jgi:hypothetical protein
MGRQRPEALIGTDPVRFTVAGWVQIFDHLGN